ncbi:LytR family transcriptional regulator [Antrihabitans cavernicola]|uniref:LytR family transcriptional regulator n=2 Tax=Antrihabitans cavernicola TaxID=2495913 RepID=A0A5A7S8M9_9NOCA|nr:LytR family transcriptional regulator [Spelaeibacter cavernicola]
MGRSLVALVALLVVVGTGAGWGAYRSATANFTQSGALDDEPDSGSGEQNILIMGLDSRLDEKGQPLPSDIYDALHAGDQNVGGYNSNVLMLLHIPGDGSKATAISIPRDDYVDLAGCDQAPCKGKIKQAYGVAYQGAKDKLTAAGVTDQQQLEQQSREAGRKAEVSTVRKFLGGVPIDHFVEVTLVAFFQIAQVVQPIEVCLNEDTSDDYSGAQFHKGVQEIDAKQATAFVRQRRDPNTDLNFTDLDRDRRQQAFIVSLSRKLEQNGTLTNFGQLQGILDVAKQNIAIDKDLDLAALAKSASTFTGGNVSFYTLPIDHFGQTDDGEDVNMVDLPTIHAIVGQLIGHQSQTSATTTPTTTAPPTAVSDAASTTLDVVNASGQTGQAAQLEDNLSSRGFVQGSASNGDIAAASSVEYGRGAQQQAGELATMLGGGLSAAANADIPSNTVRLTVGTSFTLPSSISDTADRTATSAVSSDSTTTTAPPTSVTAVPATGHGDNAPVPTDLSALSGADVPCVK